MRVKKNKGTKTLMSGMEWISSWLLIHRWLCQSDPPKPQFSFHDPPTTADPHRFLLYYCPRASKVVTVNIQTQDY